MIHRAPELKRICFYDLCVCREYPSMPSLTTDRLFPLSQYQAAKTVKTLVFMGSKLGRVSEDILGQFRDLKVLGIEYGAPNDMGLLISLVKGCQQLRGLILTAADRITQDDMRKFAKAASNLDFPTLRKVKLTPEQVRDSGPRCRLSPDLYRLQRRTQELIPTLFGAGNVDLVLEDDDYAGLHSLVEEMEKDVV
jgi:hypothetical protein